MSLPGLNGVAPNLSGQLLVVPVCDPPKVVFRTTPYRGTE